MDAGNLQATVAPLHARQQFTSEYPLSQGQRGLWFLQKLAPASPAYNVVYGTRIPGKLDVDALRIAYQMLVNRHAALRTTFAEVNGAPVQRVHASANIHFEFEDASTWKRDRLEARLAEEVYKPFDLARGPLLRVTVLKVAEDEHVMIPALHHIVTDMWSLAIMAYEVPEFYGAALSGTNVVLRQPRREYRDYVLGQEELLTSAAGEKLWEYWKRELSGELPVMNLPTDRRRPPVQTWEGAARSVVLDATLAKQLLDCATAHGVTPVTLAIAAFNVLLHRYTGQNDILVDTPRACRTADFAKVLGYFVNPVVLRSDLSGNPRFTSLLQQVREKSASAFAHGDYPFTLLIQRLGVPPDASRPPLCQVGVAWQKTTRTVSRNFSTFALNDSGGRVGSASITLESFPLKERVSPFDLTLQMAEVDGDIGATIEYSSGLFEEATIARMLGHFQTLLEGIVYNPQRRISDLPLLSDEERRRLTAQWREAEASDSGGAGVLERIQAQIRTAPNAVAIVAGEREWTYGELESQSDRVCSQLLRAGIGPECLVGICIERSLEMIAGMLGVMKTGAGLVPLDPTHPPERIAYILNDAQVAAVITDKSLVHKLAPMGKQLLVVDQDSDVAQDAAECHAPREIHGDTLAYVIYTSGSTGEPKGVAISHAAIAQHCREAQKHYGITRQDRVLQFASLNFDPAFEQILTTLMTGARLVLRDRDLWSAREFQQKIETCGLTCINIPPSYWHECMKEWCNADASSFRSLRLVIVGGDVLSSESIDQWRRSPLRGVRLLNAYGPTEVTITATTFEVRAQQQHRDRVPIGRVLPGRTAYVLDRHMNVVPIGVPGELHLGGIGLARGYTNGADLTGDKFVPDPFGNRAGARLYRTGDYVRYLPGGDIEFVGRVDHQVKLRGFRVELGDIESALRACLGAKDALVVAHTDECGDKRLVAYVVNDNPTAVSPDQLRTALKSKLPGYMIPSDFVLLDAFPLTSGGKIDRRALPLPTPIVESADSFIPPSTEMEKGIAEIWCSLLHMERVGVGDDFFRLGGHSLLATQLVSRIRQSFGVDIPLHALFADPTVGSLAKLVVDAYRERAREIEALLDEVEGAADHRASMGRERPARHVALGETA